MNALTSDSPKINTSRVAATRDRRLRSAPVVVLDPHENVVHPLPAHRRGMGGERRHGAEELLKLDRSQEGDDLVNDVQANSLLSFIPGSEDRGTHKSSITGRQEQQRGIKDARYFYTCGRSSG